MMHYFRFLPLSLIFLLVSGCGYAVYVDKAPPPPIAIADTSPRYLNVTVNISMGGYDATTSATTDLIVSFSANNRAVLFQKGETLTCNDEQPTQLTTWIEHRYASAAVSDKVFTCIYTSGQNAASIHFRMPTAPSILDPSQGATVTRSTSTPIHFTATGNITAIVALGVRDKAIARITTTGTASVDTSQFAAGAGSINLTQYPTVTEGTAAAFASFRTNATAIARSDVTWA